MTAWSARFIAAPAAARLGGQARADAKGDRFMDYKKPDRQGARRQADPAAVRRDAARGHRAAVPERVLEQQEARDLRRRRLRRAAVLVARQVRLGHGLAELHAAARAEERDDQGGPAPVLDPHRGALEARRLAPGPRVRRRAGADRPALLHELGVAALRPARQARGGGVRRVPGRVREGGCDGPPCVRGEGDGRPRRRLLLGRGGADPRSSPACSTPKWVTPAAPSRTRPTRTTRATPRR